MIASLPSSGWQQVGGGVTNGIYYSRQPTDLAILGEGWFILRDTRSGQIVYTRRGGFHTDADGYFVNDRGLRVQGIIGGSATAVGDLRVNCPPTTLFIRGLYAPIVPIGFSFRIETDGRIVERLSDDTEIVSGQVMLACPEKAGTFQRLAEFVYEPSADAPPPKRAVPGTPGFGTLLSGAVDVTPEPPRLRLLRNAGPGDPANEGIHTPTGMPTDIAIQGKGYFLLRATNTGEFFATRAGLFLVDGDGYLITYDRKRVQGPSQSGNAAFEDVRCVFADLQPAVSISIDSAGRIDGRRDDGEQSVLGAIAVVTFAHPERLSAGRLGQFGGAMAAEPKVVVFSGGNYQPRVHAGHLELANVPADLRAMRRTLMLEAQGAIQQMWGATQLAISGRGYFITRDPNDGTTCAQRDGNFHLDDEGYLVTPSGLRLQGWCDAGFSKVGDIKVDAAAAPSWASRGATLDLFRIDRSGAVTVRLSDSTEFICGCILLQSFREPFLLRHLAAGIFTNLAAALPEATMRRPGRGGAGTIEAGALEQTYSVAPLPAPLPPGVPRLHIIGEPGSRWTIQATTNFREWVDIGSVVNTGEMEWADTQAGQQPARFYRLIPRQ